MDRRSVTPMRLAMLFLVVGLVLGIGFAIAQTPPQSAQQSVDTPKNVAQTQQVAQPSVETPATVAEKPAETPEATALAADAAAEAEAALVAADAEATAGRTVSRMRMTTQAQRKAAAKKAAIRRATALKAGTAQPAAVYVACTKPLGEPCVDVDYFTAVPNFATSKLPVLTVTSAPGVAPVTYSATGGIRKFANTLAGLGPANANNLNNYIPVATPITNPWATAQGLFAGDYYEIGLFDYNHQFHSDVAGPCLTAVPTSGASLIGATTCAGTGTRTTPVLGTEVRGYKDLNTARAPAFSGTDTVPHYLGPVIIAQTDKPVRIKFTNNLTAGTSPNFFIPADISYMGMTHDNNGTVSNYSQDRATLHLHGGVTPWISDGTPHQWTVPVAQFAAEAARPIDATTNFSRGVSVQMVPDMFFDATKAYAPSTTVSTTDPGPGSLTFYYTNHQSGRLMFYHDHAWGTTRLNVYGGEAAGYLLHDGPGTATKTTLDDLIGAGIPDNAGIDATTNFTGTGLAGVAGGLYRFGIPLILQDKTFVPPLTATTAGVQDTTLGLFPAGGQLFAQDPSWNWGPEGNLWFPHVYMPNQNPNDDSGAGVAGRWDYGAWFWPPMTAASLAHGPEACVGAGDIAAYPRDITNPNGPLCPGTRNPSGVPEAFMDTPVVNGVAYPTVTLPKGAFRFQILNASNDRMMNLSLFYAADKNGNVCKTGTGTAGYTGTFNQAAVPGLNSVPADFTTCTEVKMVKAIPHAQAYSATNVLPATDGDADDTLPACASTSLLPDTNRGPGYLVIANPNAIDYNSVTGLPGKNTACWPTSWPTDGRDGGVPDPASAGPAWVQIGTEGGVLPAAVVIPPTPVGYNYNRRDIVVTNVQEHALFIGPAERADVIVDLTGVPDGSTLMLYNDSPAPVPGYDTRLDTYTGDPDQSDTGGAPTTQPGFGPNIRTMMQIHVAGASTSAGFNLATLQGVTGISKVFNDTQPPIIVPETTYNTVALGTTTLPVKDAYARIQNTTGLTYTPVVGTGFGGAITQPIINKAIHELFESDYGKMNSILAAEIPLSNFNNQTTIPLAYVDPPTEFVAKDQVQIWKVTHNGVDSHAMHFHLFNVQLINRVGWDGAIRPADPNEMGWKETVRMNPLEDAIVALRPIVPPVPFTLGESTRLLDPSRALNMTNVAGLPGFTNIDPNTGNGVTVVNAVTNFGMEYVWHCHLLGHEESDMMRPLVLKLAVPDAPVLTATQVGPVPGGPNSASLSWTFTATNGIAATGFRIQRAPVGGGFSNIATATNLGAGIRAFTDSAAPAGSFMYRIFALDSAALTMSAASNTVGPIVFGTALNPPSSLKTNFVGAGTTILAWSDTITAGATGFTLQRCAGAACTNFATIATTTMPTMTYTARNIPAGTMPPGVYQYRVQATGPAGAVSAFSNVLTVTAP